MKFDQNDEMLLPWLLLCASLIITAILIVLDYIFGLAVCVL